MNQLKNRRKVGFFIISKAVYKELNFFIIL